MPFTGLVTGAAETNAETGSWQLLNDAFCVDNTGQAPRLSGNPAPYLKALSYKLQPTANDSVSLKTMTAQCPAGKTVIGGGARIVAGSSNFAFLALQRVLGNTGWRAVAHEVNPTSANWQVWVLAICANVSTPSATANYVGNASPPSFGLTRQFPPPTAFNSISPKTLVRTCPPGSYVVGGGARVSGNTTDVAAPRGVVITRSSLGTARQWIAEARETDPTVAGWRLNAHVSCAPHNGAP
jgi:hypothetical protein